MARALRLSAELFFIASAPLLFVLLRQRLEHHHAQKTRDDEDHNGDRTGHAVILAGLEVIVEIHDKRRRTPVRRTESVCQNLRHIEHLKTADERGDDRINQNRHEKRQRDLEEDLQGACSVHIRRFKQALIDTHNARHQQNRRVAEPHKEVHQADKTAHGKADVEKVDGHVDPAKLRQDLVDRADVGKQHVEQHCERRRHDKVRHIDDGLEKLLTLDLQAVAGKEKEIKEAEGRAEAIRAVQQATADGLRAIKEAGADDSVIRLKALEAFEKAANGQATKIIVPSDIAGMAGLAKGIIEVAKEDK